MKIGLKSEVFSLEILMPKISCGGGGWWWVCKPILVFSLSLSQAEQFEKFEVYEKYEKYETYEEIFLLNVAIL